MLTDAAVEEPRGVLPIGGTAVPPVLGRFKGWIVKEGEIEIPLLD